MARGKKNAKRQAEEELARSRRNSAAHRSLRRRAQKGAGARSAQVADGTPDQEDLQQPAGPGGEAVESPAPDPESAQPASSEQPEVEQDHQSAAEEPEHEPDRLPTSELTAPAWLAAGEDAASDSPEESDSARDGSPADEEPADVDAPRSDEPDQHPAGVDAGPGAPERTSVFSPSSEMPVQHADDDATAVHPAVGDTEVMSPVDAQSDSAATATPPWSASAEQDGADDESRVPSRKRRRAAWAVPLVIALIAVLYVGAQALLSTTVPRGTEVLGLEIGGLSTAAATEEVADAAGGIESADLELRAATESFALPARDAGLSVDVEATLDQVTGFTLAPDRLWAHITGGGPISPETAVDEDSLTDALEAAAVQLDGPAQNAGVTVSDGTVEVVPGRSSVTVDQEASAQRVQTAWPAAQAIDLIADTEPPEITDEDAAAFATELETETFSAPITLVGDDAEATIEPATIAAMSRVEPGPGGLELVVDGSALAGRIVEDNPALTTDGDNASVSFDDNHEIVIDEGSPGVTIDGEALGAAVLSAAGSAERIGELPYTAADPEVSAEDLGLADFQEVISSFDTPLTADAVRTENLRVAAADVEGVIVQPGDTFDLTEALSPINEEEGYRDAGVIVNGVLTSGMGGGLSQMATTAYNAGYFAGFEILDHRPHSVWFTRYPAGRESTLYTGSINVEFRNNTPYAAVFNSYLDGGSLHVDVWSTEHFEVTTSASPKTNITEPGVKEVSSENCEPKGPGQPGFTITNTRTVYLEGEEVDQTSNTWTYKPDDAIECVSEDEDDGDSD
ncbi:VanW family protein [Demequina sp. SO4-18]|uniref:VanW family protein n=1 Tax=Demequina sp. SO4-18 TaxID=3401026 RepID=UPI003B5C51A0